MKKFFLIPLLTLVCSVMAWAGVTVSNPNAGGLNGNYDSFALAIDAISANKTAGHVITLNADESTATVLGAKTQYISEIDLNGKKLTATGYIGLQNSKSLYVHNGTINCTSANLAFVLSAQSQTLTLEKITQDESCTGKALYDLPNNQKYNVQALVQVTSGGVVEIDNQSNVSVYCSTGYPTLSNSTIHNSGTGTTYFYNQIVSDNTIGTRISGGYITGNVVLAPKYVYTGIYDAVKTYILDALIDNQFLTLYTTNSGLEPVYQFNTKEATFISAITINEIEYKFTNITTYGTQEHPAKLIQNFNGGQWISGGYIDLNGHTWSIGTSGNTPAIKPTAGKTLTIVNSQPATGCIQINGNYSASQYAMTLLTTATAPANNSVLTIGEGVVVNMPNVQGYALAVFAKNGDAGYGTIFNLNGTINVQNGAGLCINGTLKNSANKANSPVFNIAGTINAKDAAIYAAGYGEWNINDGANLSGKSGIQIKSGKLNINDGAIVHATGEGSRVPAYNNGMIESGAALQIESNSAYAGDMEIAIADDATLIADAWYAIHEYVAESNDPTAVSSISVTGGHFQGGILLSQALAAKGGFVSGGKWSKDVTANVVAGKAANPISEDPYFFEVGDPTQETAEIVNDPSKNAVLTNEDGETYASSYTSETVGDDAEVKTSTATNQVVISENTDVVVDKSDENNSTIVEVKKVTVEGDAQLSVKEGATLMVGAGSVLLDENTTTGGLTVEAGAALVVDGLVYGSTEDNFVIEGQEDKSGIVLFSPETEFIREDHPKATYRFKSKSFKDGSKWVYQRFGMPSVDGNVTVKEADGTPSTVRSFICTWDYATDDWGAWSELDKTNGLVYTDAVPFQCYQLGSDNIKDAPVTYDFIVELMGNANAPLNFKAGWNPYANSYTAPIDIKEFLTDVIANNGSDILATIYLYKDLGNDTYTWQGINLSNEMQIGAYNDMYWDNISVMEGEQFSAAEDNGYDAPKYDHNRGLSLYVINGEQHMERVATDNADGLFIGINAPVAGTYTLDFSGIVGMNYSIMDMTNNTIVTIEEDGQFNFYAEAGQNDYRFQLVAPARVPTAVENVGAKADVKGVYTITGQYIGEDINALPKGVYIINGAKVVK